MDWISVRITAGRGVGQIVKLAPAIARARIAGGTAVEVDGEGVETASIEVKNERAVTNASRPEPKKVDPLKPKTRVAR